MLTRWEPRTGDAAWVATADAVYATTVASTGQTIFTTEDGRRFVRGWANHRPRSDGYPAVQGDVWAYPDEAAATTLRKASSNHG